MKLDSANKTAIEIVDGSSLKTGAKEYKGDSSVPAIAATNVCVES